MGNLKLVLKLMSHTALHCFVYVYVATGKPGFTFHYASSLYFNSTFLNFVNGSIVICTTFQFANAVRKFHEMEKRSIL